MPCFKGLAVSIHTPDGPLAEYSIQKQNRQSRITSFIPVPPPKVPEQSTTGKPKQSTFAISITLLVPGQRVPYSAPKPTPSDPNPEGQLVGYLPGTHNDRGGYTPSIGPYIPRTTSPNETLAAYIYFDGRPKEEVATLLKRGEETWVNSRWVSVPPSEGGGLAEREFLFREVGLERWLNGLDLVGKDEEKKATIEKRHRKLESKAKRDRPDNGSGDRFRSSSFERSDVLRYGANASSPVENIMDDPDMNGSDSDDEPPEAEAAGQIKIALFRVLATGEIKRGEYEPTFGAHDDEGEPADNGDANIEHTTSFDNPKSLDPTSISTQTVTGLDTPDSPYAVFTFLYRGEQQLRKMGMLETGKPDSAASTSKRKSTDFSKLGPLNKFGTVGFTGYRDQATPKKKDSKGDDEMMDSDNDDDDETTRNNLGKDDDEVEVVGTNGELLSPLDIHKQGELSEGVRKIKLKRAHSAEPVSETRKSPHLSNSDSPQSSTPQVPSSAVFASGSPPDAAATEPNLAGISSPFKKHRASVEGLDTSKFPELDAAIAASGDRASGTTAQQPASQASEQSSAFRRDEEL